jgi:hypothetical protein
MTTETEAKKQNKNAKRTTQSELRKANYAKQRRKATAKRECPRETQTVHGTRVPLSEAVRIGCDFRCGGFGGAGT